MTDQFTVDGIFHARLTSKRESRSGIFLTIQLTPDDFSPDLAQLRAGSLLKMGWQEMVDVSVQPLEDSRGGLQPAASTVPRPQADKAGISKPKERFEDMPLVKQCVLRCGDREFVTWFRQQTPPEWWEIANQDVASVMRSELGISSRAELATDKIAAKQWREIDAAYQNWLTDQRHAGSRR